MPGASRAPSSALDILIMLLLWLQLALGLLILMLFPFTRLVHIWSGLAVLFVAQTGFVHPGLGVQLAVTAFVATVIGGLGSLPGAVLGGFLVFIGATLPQAFVPPALVPFRDAFLYLAVILILLVKPDGLIPARGLKERI